MKVTRSGKRRAAAINSVKVLLTSASLAATLGGWAAISTANGSALQVAQLTGSTSSNTAVQDWIASRGSTVASVSTTNSTGSATVSSATTAVTNQTLFQPTVRTRSSR